MSKRIAILTAGGDSPGLNAAIRAVGKAAQRAHGMEVIGFRDGFKGFMNDNWLELDSDALSGILTRGGTILGTSRAKVHKMELFDGSIIDGRERMMEVFRTHNLDSLVCLGGDGTARNAIRLSEVGMPVVTLPKTIDNDVAGTDVTFGFDTAMTIATEAIDRLHSTAHSHHRIMVVELMGHEVGWLALGAGVAGGADVILIPEIPYDVEAVASSISARRAVGSAFSIVAVAEGAYSREDAVTRARLLEQLDNAPKGARNEAKRALKEFGRERRTERLAATLSEMTGLESRVTILGHVQRGGTPTPTDRLLATRIGTAGAAYIARGFSEIMVGVRANGTEPVPLREVAGKTKAVPADHPWLTTARHMGIALGD